MRAALFRCDGAAIPREWTRRRWDLQEHISHLGSGADLNLRLENLSHAILGRVDARAAELVRIAAYVYAADRSVSRGGQADVYGKDWRRHIALAVPVADPDFWSSQPVLSLLSGTLGFLSDDLWQFSFSPARSEAHQLLLEMPEEQVHQEPDTVVMFSGGADSLCAAIELVADAGGRPVLVSHRSTPRVDHLQRLLVHKMRRRFPQWVFPQVSLWAHRKGSEAPDTSQRTRSFLYASLGAAVASELNVRRVLLADNGIVSLNVPINAQLVGALASRTTHPEFIRSFNDLAGTALPRRVHVSNPLWSRTRREVLGVLDRTGAAQLLQETVSCAHNRGRPLPQPHCGGCSQCIDRRFATVGAGLEEHDLAKKYELDVFRDALPEGEARTVAVSYVRFALEVQRTPAEDLFLKYPQLEECILPDDRKPSETAEQLTDLLKRHALSTLAVMKEEVARASAELVAGDLPETCLVRLVAAGSLVGESGERAAEEPLLQENEEADDRFRHSPDYRSVEWRGERFAFTPRQAQAIEILHREHANRTPEVGQAYILESMGLLSSRLRDVFKKSGAWGTLVIPGKTRGTVWLNI